ncbi:hypothetical protein HYE69_05535 [Staphylococcus sp. GSSP0090]|nr:hypothetical protein [Staphylococcus sp. GSSP0090]
MILGVTFIITTILNLTGTDIGLNRYGEKLANVELLNIYDNKKLNGLITIGLILAAISFLYTLFVEKEKDKMD